MSPRPTQFSAFVALIAMSAGFALAEDKPPPPDVRVPDLVGSKAIPLSLDRDAPFDTETHEKILKDLVTNTYVAQLRKALFVQDKVHQFESKAHFDNCDFDGSVA